MAGQLHYLTVQDILWINLQVTGKVNHFSYAKLEEATFYQYAYGDSKDLFAQAARFIPGFLKMRPLDAGNEATAFIACLTFLKINSMRIELLDGSALSWFDTVSQRKGNAIDDLKTIAKPEVGHYSDSPAIRSTIRDLISEYACTLLKM